MLLENCRDSMYKYCIQKKVERILSQGFIDLTHYILRGSSMDFHKLKEAEAAFLQRFPGGFADPDMAHIKKSHNVDKLAEYTKANLTRTICHQPQALADVLLTIVSRSSMVSRFEKPKFRDFLNSLDSNDKERLARAFEERLYGRNKQRGFEEICDMLAYFKLARWSVISAVPFYLAPTREAFVKPTTAKNIIKYLGVDDLHYHPTPTWEFYKGYQKLIREIKKEVNSSLTPNNAALTGFLMVSI